MQEKRIREYVSDYVKYYPERWRWQLKNSIEQSELHMRTRARRSRSRHEVNSDLLPDFYSIERDAAQFGLREVEWTDIFGLVWQGKKGIFAYAGAPNYEHNLYYFDAEECEDGEYCVSSKYNAYNKEPPKEIYSQMEWNGVTRWIDTADVQDAEYQYIVNNHLFKDTHIELIYEDGERISVYEDYGSALNGLFHHGKEEIVKKILKGMNEHFVKLRDSERDEVRAFYPGETAEEMFGMQDIH